MDAKQKQNIIERPPVVVIMGHIDHGKSSLLDFIRKSNVVSKEAGGITQHLGAYEIEHKNAEGITKKITFLDTPGHSAFCGVRTRGAKVADIAILIISAEDGVMPQTIEALECIKKDNLSFIVAINKIDSPKANIEKVKSDLIENQIYVEGYGGTIPVVNISAKEGTNINELLDLILVASEVEGLKADTEKMAEGFVIETHKDKNKGISATLVIKNGTLKQGQFVACCQMFSPIRIFEDHDNKSIKSATVSRPVKICGWNEFPVVGEIFYTFNSKKEAEKYCEDYKFKIQEQKNKDNLKKQNTALDEIFTVPIIIKADTHGSIEAVEHELKKINTINSKIKIISTGTGNITEIDAKTASGNENTIIVGFGIEIDTRAQIIIDRMNVIAKTFDIIYELTDWIEKEIENKRPRIEVEETTGKAKILKKFNENKNMQVLGARVLEGKIKISNDVKILRRSEEIGRARIKELQSQKQKVGEVDEGTEFGLCIESKFDIVPGDEIEIFEKIKK
ncbi:MAG TPA: translation initiation factor IF-2 [Candidatus Paceibacterota bacterium]|nr:translation initiation factor IF-2 [Candidatus Paceibacterota bacterium]HMP18816.1 translation initiation factor IF-2 [Candidatus Paceibacterota bacterium]HMP85414.1 translation initiation factor IF-2 [Candidatus Paceibacterota bacterium]